MKLHISMLLGSAVLISVLCHVYCQRNDEGLPTERPTNETTSTASESSTKTSEHAANTTEHTTTTAEHTTHTTESTTSSATSHDTTRLTTEHTTSVVVTTTGQPVTTTVPPTPAPQPAIFTWNVTEKNVTCILLQAGIRMTFSYQRADHKPISGYIVDVPDGAVANGTCGSTIQTIGLSFFEDWYLNLTFMMNTTTHKYDLAGTSLDYKITSHRFPGFNDSEHVTDTVYHYGDMFVTDDHKKFVCVAAQKLYTSDNVTNGPEKIETFSLTFEAFRQSSEGKFTDNAKHCEQDEVSQLVPIIVGAALGGLILIVLIAYLIGRKRSRRGYESV